MISSSPQKPRSLVIGLGNAYRGDDAVGPIVARRLREEPLDGVAVLEKSMADVSLMESWPDADAVILVDAVRSGGEPGTLYRFEAHQEPLPAEVFPYSTHSFSLAGAIELARALRRLPSYLIVYGIEGRSFEPGGPISPEVGKAVEKVVQLVLQDLEELTSGGLERIVLNA